MATLAVYRGDRLERQVELGEATMRIGRAPENELVLEDRDKGVSRTHAEIRYDRGRHIIVDLNSQNGVWAGERRLRMDPLPAGVPITIGPYRLVFEPEGAAAEPEASSAGAVPVVQAEERPIDPTEFVEQGVRPAQTQVVGSPARKRPNWMLIGGLAGAGVLALALVVAMALREPPTPPPETTTSTTTTTAPPEQTAEQRFEDHLARAEAHIRNGDQASALAENAEALDLRPSDERGTQQRAKIDAMPSQSTVVENPPIIPEGAPRSARPPRAATPSTLTVASRPKETAAERENREETARDHLDEAKKALEARQWADAIKYFDLAVSTSGRQDFGYKANEASEGLQAARAARTEAEGAERRATAKKLVDEAKALAASDIPGAVRRLREAMDRDPQQVAAVAELLRSLLEQTKVVGEEALGDGKNYENKGRTELAIRAFERASQHLELVPGGHEGVALAREHLAKLKAPK